jgi:hypothetical protein
LPCAGFSECSNMQSLTAQQPRFAMGRTQTFCSNVRMGGCQTLIAADSYAGLTQKPTVSFQACEVESSHADALRVA